ncbi:hypothetical protein ACIBIZ_40105 [Nonomuraea spiralis]|uniref:hypothetical protein n=1 Tax=Nonomuraea TaxID=83681 RepID=UPI000F777BE9|nr:hypothetical protein [Nonomuraea sp. WAC 01424]
MRNGRHQPRKILATSAIAAMALPANDKRIDDPTGERQRLSPTILAARARARRTAPISDMQPRLPSARAICR